MDTRDKIASFGINAKLTSFPGNVHVPFDRYGDLIEKQSAKLPYRSLDLADAQR